MKTKIFLLTFFFFGQLLYSKNFLNEKKDEYIKRINKNNNDITILYDMIKLSYINNYFDDRPFDKVIKSFKTKNKLLDSYVDLFRYRIKKVKIGFPDNYYVIGPFDNKGNSGFEKNYPPENEFKKGKKYEGKNQKVFFKTIKNYEKSFINLKNYLNPKHDSLGYALFFIKVKKSNVYQVRFSAANRYELFLDKKSIIKSDNKDYLYYDKNILNIYLKKGIHSLLVKLDNGTGKRGFYLRVLNKKGKYTRNIKFVLKDKYPEKFPKSKLISNDDKIKKQLDKIKKRDYKYYIRRAFIERYFIPYDKKVKPYPFEKYYEEALKLDLKPEEKAEVYLNIYKYGSNKTDNMKYLEEAVKSENFEALLTKAAFDINIGNLPQAHELINRARKIDKYNYDLLLLLNRYYMELGINYIKEIIHLYKKSKRVSKYFEFKVDKLKFKDIKKLIKIYEYNKKFKYFNYDDFFTLLSYYKDTLNFEKYEKELNKKLKKNSLSFDYNSRMITFLFSLKKYDKLLKLYKEKEELLSDSAKTLKILAKTYLLLGNTSKSNEYYKKYLELVPNDTKVKEYLSYVKENKKELWANKYMDKLALNDIDYKKYKGGNVSEKLYEHTIVKINDDYTFNLYKKVAVAVNNENAVNRFKYLPIYYLPNNEKVYNSEVKLIKKSGEVEIITDYSDKFYRSKNNGAFTNYSLRGYYIANLEKDDIIEYSYYLKNDNIYEDPFFAAVYNLNSSMPSKRITFTFISDKKINFNHKPVKTSEKEYFFDFRDLKEVKSEPYWGGYSSNYDYLSVSTLSDWQEVINWYKGLLLNQDILPKYVKEEIHKGTDELKNITDKIKWIQKYVFTHTHYIGIELGLNAYKPFSATEVLERKYGDCKDKANLFNALLKEIGIDSKIVLLRTNGLGRIKEQIPANPKYFNHAISYIPDLNLFVDLTADKNGLFDLPFSDQEATGLIIRDNEKLITLPSYKSNETIKITGSKDKNDFKGEIVFKVENSLASSFRYRFENKELRKNRIEGMLKKVFDNFTIESFETENFEDINKPFILKVKLTVKDFFKKNRIKSTIYMETLTAKEGLLEKREENYRRLKLSVNEIMEIKNIEPKKIEVKDKNISNKYLNYNYKINISGNTVKIVNKIDFLKFTIEVDEYPEYKKGIEEIGSFIKNNFLYLGESDEIK